MLRPGQFQLDVYGELIRGLHDSEQAGMGRTQQGRRLEHAILAHVERVWIEPDQGLWESRGEARHYTFSKVMAWVALHRFLDGEGKNEIDDAERCRIEALRDQMHEVICREGFDPGLGSFTSYFGGQQVDASLLMLPLIGFLPASDERMAGTIDLIEKTLVHDGLVRRHRMDALVPEGAFLACSFWLAEAQLMLGPASRCGRHDRARAVDPQRYGPAVGRIRPREQAARRQLSAGAQSSGSHSCGAGVGPIRSKKPMTEGIRRS